MNLPLPVVAPGTRSKGEVNTCTPLLDMGPETTSLAMEFLNSSMAAAADGVLLVLVLVLVLVLILVLLLLIGRFQHLPESMRIFSGLKKNI